jgi:O-antigen/teichoic acid export membrane protein
MAAASAPATTPAIDALSASRKQIRGSTLLFTGRMLSVGINFAVQVLIVRYLSKADFGVFAYGLSLVALGQSISILGLDKAVSRFLPIYDEDGAHGKMLGTLLLVGGTIFALGLAFIAVVFGFYGMIVGSVGDQGRALTVLMILLVLSPIQALDDVLMATFAVFSRARSIFVRRYILAPGLRLAAILAVLAAQSDVRALAAGYVAGGGLGVVMYAVILVRTLRARGLLRGAQLRRLSMPAREIYGFALPLVTVDLMFAVMNTSNVVMLGHFGTVTDVADYRVVQPAARLNMLVMTSFGLLFTPLAARLYARQDRAGIHELYWRTAVWMAVFSFPVFAATFALALLSLGYYFGVALGFNGLTLRVYGLVRYSVVISVVATVANVALNLVLIPAYGAVGAGVGTCATLVLHNVLKQAGLRHGTGISVFEARHLRVYGVIVAVGALLLGLQHIAHPNFPVALVAVAAGSAVVLALTRDALRVADMFPEVGRIPVVRRLLT